MPRQRNLAIELAADIFAQAIPGNDRAHTDPKAIADQAVRRYGSQQKPGELTGFLSMLERTKPRTLVEIGTGKGGTLYGMAQVAADDALLVSIDMPLGAGGGGYRLRDEFGFAARRVLGQRQRYIRADSHDVGSNRFSTYNRLCRILGNRAVDCLFIDGDHSYQGVMEDYLNYKGLVRKGGIIALHDIVHNPFDATIEVDRAWTEIKKLHYNTIEIIDPKAQNGIPERGGGIGVITC